MTFLLAIFQNKVFRQIGAALLFVIGIFGMGAKWKADQEEKRRLEAAAKTHERINDADTGKGDADADREWLHDRGKS